MSRDRACSTASSGPVSDHNYSSSASNTPQRRQNNNNRGGGVGHNNHNDYHNGGGHRSHEMTLLCHRVDLFDDFVPGGKKCGHNSHAGGLVPIHCLGADRGCACHTPCAFCHTVMGEDDQGPDEIEAPADIHPNLAFLFAGNSAKKPPTSGMKEKEAVTSTTVSSTLVVDQIFAQNHGLLSDNVEGGVKVKKYHHPPVGRYRFTPPLMNLPTFFDETLHPKQTGHKECNKTYGNGKPKEESKPKEVELKEEGSAGLDSFFDDFALIPPPKPAVQEKKRPKQKKDHDGDILVFRAPLKTVVKRTVTCNNSDGSGKCPCELTYENLVKGSTQQNPHDPSIVHDKYWAQRRRLFKRFDEGIQLDAEGWYSVTPEVVADHVASRFADASHELVHYASNEPREERYKGGQIPMVVLDAFCGCGGNAIAFAKLPSSVVSLIICVDVDRTKLRKAAHNASIYCIPPNRIIFVEANSVAVMERCYRDGNLIMDPPPRTPEGLLAYPPREMHDDFTIGGIDLLAEYAQHIDAVFMDPPWGGMDYGQMGKDGYDLSRDMKIRGCERGCVGFPPTPEVDGVQLLKIAAAATSTRFVAYDLPRNANKRSLANAALEAGYEGNSKLEEHYLNGRLKTVTGYFGNDFRHLLDLKKYHK